MGGGGEGDGGGVLGLGDGGDGVGGGGATATAMPATAMPATAVAASRGDGDGGGGPEEGSGLAAASGDGDGGDTTARVPSRRGLLGGDELFWTTNISQKRVRRQCKRSSEGDRLFRLALLVGHGTRPEVLMGLTGGRL